MKFLIVLAFVAGAFANDYHVKFEQPTRSSYSAPAAAPAAYGGYSAPALSAPIPIRSFTQDISSDGMKSNFGYESGNGIRMEENTRVEMLSSGAGYGTTADEPKANVIKTGSYSYTSPDGTPITVNYVADKDGFRPVGAHLPTSPPIPEEIRASLAGSYSSGYSSYSAPALPVRSSHY